MKNGTIKVHRNFKLDPKLERQLRREAKRKNVTETWIVEQALRQAFLLKDA